MYTRPFAERACARKRKFRSAHARNVKHFSNAGLANVLSEDPSDRELKELRSRRDRISRVFSRATPNLAAFVTLILFRRPALSNVSRARALQTRIRTLAASRAIYGIGNGCAILRYSSTHTWRAAIDRARARARERGERSLHRKTVNQVAGRPDRLCFSANENSPPRSAANYNRLARHIFRAHVKTMLGVVSSLSILSRETHLVTVERKS